MAKLKLIEEQFEDWFLEYSSYVILERAIPSMDDGLKPVQRRILHALKTADDGTLHKVQSLVGEAVKYHPHGDMAIKDALVNLGQKELLIETQGNWGNILTGDSAAAGRYIEARLSKLARENIFCPKITTFIPSYDGRNQEPKVLPAKFPILLIQGAEGIAVGLSCKILPHNFTEVIDAAIAVLRKESFQLYPDFATGGIIDVSNYCDGKSGGRIRARSIISELNKYTLVIEEVPYGVTTTSLRDSIVIAAEKGKLKIRKIEDLTSSKVQIHVEFHPGQDLDKAKEALFAFTNCEVSLATNAVTILNGKPCFTSISDILIHNVNRTKELIKLELELELAEQLEIWHRLSIEKIFIEEKLYTHLEISNTEADANELILQGLLPYQKTLKRAIEPVDIERLSELKLNRIAKFNKEKYLNDIIRCETKQIEIVKDIKNLTKTVIRHFKALKDKYNKDFPRKTTIQEDPFKKITQSIVSAESQKVYCQREEGFIGTNLKKDELLPFEINPLTDILTASKHGIIKINRVGAKTLFAEDLLDIRIFDKKDIPIYCLIYTNSQTGVTFAKRFTLPNGFVRDKAYYTAGGKEANITLYMGLQGITPPKITLQVEGKKTKHKEIIVNFEEISIKNRDAIGNTVTKNKISKIKNIKQ